MIVISFCCWKTFQVRTAHSLCILSSMKDTLWLLPVFADYEKRCFKHLCTGLRVAIKFSIWVNAKRCKRVCGFARTCRAANLGGRTAVLPHQQRRGLPAAQSPPACRRASGVLAGGWGLRPAFPWWHAMLDGFPSHLCVFLGEVLFTSFAAQSLSRVRLFATPWTAARQASLSLTYSRSLL